MNKIASSRGSSWRSSKHSFGDDVRFLSDKTDLVVLNDPSSSAAIAVAPGLQARVMTSSVEGYDGYSYGWINRELIAEGRRRAHMNAFGGEDRFWLGPEGGQFGIFFDKDAPFDFEHWQTPEPIDWGAWTVVRRDERQIEFRRDMSLSNWLGTTFDLRAERFVRMLTLREIETLLDISVSDRVKAVGYQTDNRITNEGSAEWKKETGLLSIWILAMLKPSPAMVIVIPFRAGPPSVLGEIVNDAYFGKVPRDRLKVAETAIFFKGDGLFRSKIGVSPRRARDVIGSYDRDNGALTLIKFDLPGLDDYVNSMWEIQKEPYRGDVVNSYNDGPPAPGEPPMGPFYELETSSPAAALRPGEAMKHAQRTFHFQGTKKDLDSIVRENLGVGMDEINAAF